MFNLSSEAIVFLDTKGVVLDINERLSYSSGYSINPIMANYKEYGFAGAITKPFKIKELTTLLQKVIDGSDK